MGSASLYQLARRGARVLGIDRFHPPHDQGSSHGESRITRQAIGEGEEYVPFVLRSYEIWRELEAETGEQLLFEVGGLSMTRESGSPRHHGQGDFVGRSIAAAQRFGIVHEVLRAPEIQQRFPPFRLIGDEIGYYEPGAGYVRPERCVTAQLDHYFIDYHVKDDPEIAALTIDDLRESRLLVCDPAPIPLDEMQRTFDWLKSWGMLDRTASPVDLVDLDVQRQAHAAL